MAGVLTLETEVLQLAHQEQVQTPTMTNSNGNDIADLAIQEQCQRIPPDGQPRTGALGCLRNPEAEEARNI